VLNLADNKITSKGMQMICELMAKVNTLEELQLQNNDIDNNGAKALLQQLNTRNISRLDVDNNKISGDILTKLLGMVPVRKLHLVRNKLSDQQVGPLHKNMIETKNLRLLYMSHNHLSDNALGLFAQALTANPGMTEISFTHNDLSLPNGLEFVKALKHMKGLKKLSLNSCMLDLELLDELKNSLENTDSLTDICLYSNEINSEGAQLIAYMLANKFNLRTLGLSNNYIGHGDTSGAMVNGVVGGCRMFNNLSVSTDALSGFVMPAIDVDL